MFFFNRLIFIFFCLYVFTGCARYKISTDAFNNCHDLAQEQRNNQENALSKRLYYVIPRHRCQLVWYDLGHWTTWLLFGNDDDGIFGEAPTACYRVRRQNTFRKAASWWLRNPLHNFCYYVIGSADRVNGRLTLLQISKRTRKIMTYSPVVPFEPEEKSAFLAALHGGKPFLSLLIVYNRKWKSHFYIGWRERGNFGLKFVPIGKH